MARQGERWFQKAACQEHPDPDLWHRHEYITGGSRARPSAERIANITAAKEFCDTCPVKQACLDYALDTREYYGIWGGLTGQERRDMLVERGLMAPPRKRENPPCGTKASYVRGCSCDLCRAAERDYKRARRVQRSLEGSLGEAG